VSAIRLRNVEVNFPLYHAGNRSLKKSLLAFSTKGNVSRDSLNRVMVKALGDLNLTLEQGDRIGLVGANGAGKTTLLRVLAGIFEPTSGRIDIDGKVTAILDASVGLDPDSTGRENIILRGMYMGKHPRQMRSYVDSITAFADLGSHIDMPTRTYSSGMMVQLAFAISTCIPPEILLMDEWLAAGDARFLVNARKRMAEFVSRSSILVFASHSMTLLREWCQTGLMLEHGHIVAAGPIGEIIDAYEARMGAGEPAG
jgi:ABC-2 type transport system ATP-binding protein/lipopolysaccharide transport system ATP-binding protein